MTGTLPPEDPFVIDADAAQAESIQLAARITSGDDARGAFREILRVTGSELYGKYVAEHATHTLASMLLSDEFSNTIVPVIANRLAAFIADARLEIGLHRFAQTQHD